MQYSIEARSWKIMEQSYLPTVASHNFWVLRDQNNKIIAQLHGLATDRETGEIMAIGYNQEKHSLRAHQKKSPTYMIRSDQDHHTVYKGDAKDVLERWNAAVKAIDYINQKDLNYPSWGVKVWGKTINSNSTYRTLGEIMGVKIHEFSGVAEPGLDNKMLNDKEIEQFKYKKQPKQEKNTNVQPIQQQTEFSPPKSQQANHDAPHKPLKTLEEAKAMAKQTLADLQALKDDAFARSEKLANDGNLAVAAAQPEFKNTPPVQTAQTAEEPMSIMDQIKMAIAQTNAERATQPNLENQRSQGQGRSV